MKNYVITVNGTSYEVSVEEVNGAATEPTVAMPSAAPVAKPAPAPKAAAVAAAGSVTVNSPMPGKIIDVKVGAGAAVKRGDVILILEAMKMENEIVAPQDGTVASVNVSAGDAVEAGAVLATLN
ncbi:MAG: biotin/lipoyl-binding protein [Clostridiales bacterium]|nr:biotin/lipoyl-binding protein [Clostridiales bacterium]